MGAGGGVTYGRVEQCGLSVGWSPYPLLSTGRRASRYIRGHHKEADRYPFLSV